MTTAYPKLSPAEEAVAERMARDGSFHATVALQPEGHRFAIVRVCVSVVQKRVDEEREAGIHPCGCSASDDPEHNWLDCEKG